MANLLAEAPIIPNQISPKVWTQLKTKFDPRQLLFGILNNSGETFHLAYQRLTPQTDTDIVKSGTYKWTVSPATATEFFLELDAGGDPLLDDPDDVKENSVVIAEGTIGALTAGQWTFGDNDSNGFDTVYIRLTDSVDPDTKADGFVEHILGTDKAKPMADTGEFYWSNDAIPPYLWVYHRADRRKTIKTQAGI